MKRSKRIERALQLLDENTKSICKVREWSKLVGYKKTKKFSRHFFRIHKIRPIKVLTYLRLKHIISQLKENNKLNYEIAWEYGFEDEKRFI